MWRMLCERGHRPRDRRTRTSHAEADRGSAHWDADYTFSGTGRHVHNEIDASFRVRERADRRPPRSTSTSTRWTRQALGPVGLLLGWSPPVQNKVRGQARENLHDFMADRLSDRLSASDMSSLLAERGPIHVHVGATIVVEGKPPPFERAARARRHAARRWSRAFASGSPRRRSASSNPVWTDDPRFDIRWHVRRVALPSPGGMAELRELVGRIMSEPLDFTRPLWQLYLVEGLEGKPPRLRQQDPPRARRRGRRGRRRHDRSSTRARRAWRSRSPTSAGSPTSRARSCCSSARVSDRIRQPLRVARKAARETLDDAALDRDAGDADGRVVREARRQRPDGAADLPQPGDRPRPPGRLRRDRARRC